MQRWVVLFILFFVSGLECCVAQSASAVSRQPACGDSSAGIPVKAASTHLPAPDPSKAVIYFIEKDAGVSFAATTRFGIDGKWVGATHGRSWFALNVEPGERHLCADAHLKQLWTGKGDTALAHLSVEAGTTYYFEVKVLSFTNQDIDIALIPMDSDEGHSLISEYPHSNVRLRDQ